jgi:hypothetical protein
MASNATSRNDRIDTALQHAAEADGKCYSVCIPPLRSGFGYEIWSQEVAAYQAAKNIPRQKVAAALLRVRAGVLRVSY